MRRFFCIALLFFIPGLLKAQDTLYKPDGTRQNVKILEVNKTQLKYKSAADPGGPTYVISKEDVLKIVYGDGTAEVFLTPAPPGVIKEGKFKAYKTDPRETDFGRNLFSFTLTDLLFRSLTLSYEHTYKSGDFSLRFPVSIGLTSLGLADYDSTYDIEGDYYNRNKVFSIGADFCFYPYGQGKAKFFFGASSEYGRFIFVPTNSYYYSSSYEKRTGSYFAFLLQSGLLLQPSKNLNGSLNIGIGYAQRKYGKPGQYYFPYSNSNREGHIVLRGGISIGYKF